MCKGLSALPVLIFFRRRYYCIVTLDPVEVFFQAVFIGFALCRLKFDGWRRAPYGIQEWRHIADL